MRNMDTAMKELFEKMSMNRRDFEDMDSFGYTMLQRPLEILNIVYPNEEFDEARKGEFDRVSSVVQNMVGKTGLMNIMNYEKKNRLG